ncbi:MULTISPECIES: hypothetical protein [unclassified Serratia (in: enterobacteria)]|uniref:hypothetical protein n=1 Tax=unclassified Serratia (in: enterobacteria) TaxID=2647522 RepID=UPI00046AD4ED|nr:MULTISPECIES: hypothetical protein [unclassified Serratia (in: enterobacteria)]
MSQQNTHEQEIIAAIKQFARSATSKGEALADISMLVAATSTLPLTNLDNWERLIRWQLAAALRVNKPSNEGISSEAPSSLAWIDLCSGDGFKREKALQTLSGAAPNSFYFALAVRRLNDWVPEIRKATCDVLPSIAKATDPEIIVDVLFITLPYWYSWGRMGDVERQVLLQVISLEKVTACLKQRLISATSGPMSSILTQIGRAKTLDNYLADIAQSAIQPSLRAKAYRCQFEGKFVWREGEKWVWTDKVYGRGRYMPLLGERAIDVLKPFMENLTMAINDRSPIVRRIAGEMLIKELDNIGEQASILAKILASDPSPSVSERGKFALKTLGVHVD